LPHPTAIQSGIGNAETEDATCRLRADRQVEVASLPQRTSKQRRIFIRLERFQIGLPLQNFGIILRTNRHYPVVPANTQT
jgi:hypothetical protein